MSVTQSQSTPTVRVGTPIDRKHLDRSRTPARVIAGVVFVGYSVISTVIGVQGDLAPLAWTNEIALWTLTYGFVLGLLAAVVIFAAEVLLAEVSLFWFVLFLLPDAWYTRRFSGWLGELIHAHLQSSPMVETIAAEAVMWLAAVACAYFGERLLFGKRRRM